MNDSPNPPTLFTAVLIVLLGLGLMWLQMPQSGPELTAAPVPTLQPTAALVVPTAAPVQPAPVYIERVEAGASVVINNNTTNVNVCISLRCD